MARRCVERYFHIVREIFEIGCGTLERDTETQRHGAPPIPHRVCQPQTEKIVSTPSERRQIELFGYCATAYEGDAEWSGQSFNLSEEYPTMPPYLKVTFEINSIKYFPIKNDCMLLRQNYHKCRFLTTLPILLYM